MTTWPAAAAMPYGSPERWDANVTFEIWDGEERVSTQIVNQQEAPSDIEYDGWNWKQLADEILAESDRLYVRVTNRGTVDPIVLDSVVAEKLQEEPQP